jgi:glycosyltransferase involved in cell wall biosynthesis
MRVWLVTIGEPLPTDRDPRSLRTGMVAEMMARAGHEVVWWTSEFDHSRRRHRFATDVSRMIRPNLRLEALRGVAYRRSVSFTRLANHAELAYKFWRAVGREPRPDLIVSSLPTIELCLVAARYGRAASVPVVLDMRDMWPDIFAELAPRALEPLARAALSPLARALARACADATAITGITDAFVDWGVTYAGRARSPLDRAFPLGYSGTRPDAGALAAARQFWRARGVTEESGEFIACFFGAVGRQFDIDTVLDAAHILARRGRRARFVFCGDGDDLRRLREAAHGLPGVTFPGWVDRAQIAALMDLSSVGLAPYVGGMGYEASYPNKIIEYLSSGLPIVTCLEGLLRELVERDGVGVYYRKGDALQLAAEIEQLAGDRAALSRMRQAAAGVFRERFVAEDVYAAMIRHFERLVAENKGRPPPDSTLKKVDEPRVYG